MMARQLTIRQKIAKLEKEANSLYFNSHKGGNVSPQQLRQYEMKQREKYNRIQQEILKLRQEYQMLVAKANELEVKINEMDMTMNNCRASGARVDINGYKRRRTQMVNEYQNIRKKLM